MQSHRAHRRRGPGAAAGPRKTDSPVDAGANRSVDYSAMCVLRSRVRAAIREAGKIQRDVAIGLGMPKETISRIANGRIPNLRTAFLLARELGVAVDDLFVLENTNRPAAGPDELTPNPVHRSPGAGGSKC